MRLRFIPIIVSVTVFLSFQAYGEDQAIWSRQSHGLIAAGLDAKGTATVASPDKHAELRLHSGKFELFVNGVAVTDLSNLIGSVSLAEILWSPDSDAFFVNSSDGGEVGTWKSYVYVLTGGGAAHEIHVDSLIAKRSALKTTCNYKNIGSLAWVDGHAKIFLIEQVPSSSECSNMDSISGYVVDVEAGRVLDVLDKAAMEKRFGPYLGNRSRSLVEGR
jgi:hypothetical protein